MIYDTTDMMNDLHWKSRQAVAASGSRHC